MEPLEPYLDDEDPLNVIARTRFGISGLYPYQRLAIINVLETLDSVGDEDVRHNQIVLLPTGSGKSLCFMLPAVMIEGITMVVFPILSLISDQLRRCNAAGIVAASLRGGMTESEREQFEQGCTSGATKLILTNPEMLMIPRIRNFLAGLPIRHIVIDEAHTVPEWGETFRPSCLELIVTLRHINPTVVSAFTATASPEVTGKISHYLFPGENPVIIAGNPDRPNISYACREVLSPSSALVHYSRILNKPLIVFCPTRKEAERNALLLRHRLHSHEIRFYHAGLTREEKQLTEKWFFSSSQGILTATCAYGMGVDKADIRSVIHTAPPPSPEAYLQESGRAGRDGRPAQALLLQKCDWEGSGKNKLHKYVRNYSECRRVQLLRFLDHEAEDCAGCDVCSGQAYSEAEELPLFRTMIGKRNGQIPPGEAVKLLKGLPTCWIKENDWHKSSWFGTLSDWYMEEISEALMRGIKMSYWKIIRFGIGKGNLQLNTHTKRRPFLKKNSLLPDSRTQQNDFFK